MLPEYQVKWECNYTYIPTISARMYKNLALVELS